MKKIDIDFTYGARFEKTFTLYSDPRMKRFRGIFKAWAVYEEGDAVEYEGAAWVALLRTRHIEPNTPASTPFWSPMAPLNLTGYTVTMTLEGVAAELHPALVAPAGIISPLLEPSIFEHAPSSCNYYIKMVEPTGAISYPIGGTALFRKP